MKLPAYVILICTAFAACTSEQGIILSTHENGQVHERLILTEPVTEDSLGVKQIFFPNGDLQCEGG